ncbi:putative Abc transporter, partial [Daphnia magna]
DMFAMFPRLKEREHTEAGVLSGGEQQMLTLCRTLMGDPDLIIIDEPTEGLAPKIVELVGQFLHSLKAKGVSVLLIEQKLTIAMSISDRALVMGHGAIVFEGTPDELRANAYIRKEWLESSMTAEYKVHGDVAVITMMNPPVNGLGLSTRIGITDGLEKANNDASVKAIVITGAGKAFSG